ncbi:MAG TPA: hypothetical protein PKM27_14535 [Saprospiraceae bacterium]|nr:hypothetical protein [Saprospiraceae bacterium]HNT21983.1 hypothetical protein [Saprospiraceae bacterium]
MTPNHIETEFREKSRSIRIQPSAGSWDELSKRLDRPSSRQPFRLSGWMAMAASFAGILLVSSLFLFQPSRKTDPFNSLPPATTFEYSESDLSSSIYEQISTLHEAYRKMGYQ